KSKRQRSWTERCALANLRSDLRKLFRCFSAEGDESHETFNSFCSGGGCAFFASVDAKLEAASVEDWCGRDFRLRLYARGAQTARSIAPVNRCASKSVASRARETSAGLDIPDRQEHGRPDRVPRVARGKSGRPGLSRVSALRHG